MKYILVAVTFAVAVCFGSLGQFWNATGWTLLTFATIMLIIQHENHKAELAKKEDELFYKNEKLCNEEIAHEHYKIQWDFSRRNAMQLFHNSTNFAERLKDIAVVLPTAEELEDPELREFYSLVIEEIKYQNL